jgi:hypothetical protein
MRNLLKTTLLAAAVIFFASPAFAQIQITGLAANGSGCPRGSVVALNNGDQASILFSAYNVTTSQRVPVQTKSCSVAVGMVLDEGLQVIVSQVQWMGTSSLSPGSTLSFIRSIGFTGGPSIQRVQEFRGTRGGTTVPFTLRDQIGGVAFSSCFSRNAIARASTSLTARGANSVGEVQSADFNAFSTIILRLDSSRIRC